MSVNVRGGGDLDQLMLMPPSIREWLPSEHLAFFILDTVEELDLTAFYAAHRADGRGGAVYDPKLMLALLIYAYCIGERSSRKIERRLVEDVAFRVVAANEQPDHATLARFRRRHEGSITELFAQVLRLCVTSGLVTSGLIAIDGTKMKANASFFANKNSESLRQEADANCATEEGNRAGENMSSDAAQGIAQNILDEANEVDAAEDLTHGESRGGQMPAEWAGGRDRRARIRAALDQLDRQRARDYEARMAERAQKEADQGRKLRGPKPKPDTARRPTARRANTTDPHSRIIPQASKGVLQGYNAQAAVTAEHIIVAADVAATTNDQPHFLPMANAVTKNLTSAGHDQNVGTFVADAGYWTAENATTDVAAAVLIATQKGSWRQAPKPDDDKLMILAKVNRRELSQREAAAILGVSYTWVRDMTKRYFGTEGQRLTRTTEAEPEEWIPIIEQVDRGEISRRAAADQLTVSNSRIKTMLAHVRGETVDPQIARRDMDRKLKEPANAALYAKRSSTIETVFGNIKGNLAYRTFSVRSLPAVTSEWNLICTAHNLLKMHRALRP